MDKEDRIRDTVFMLYQQAQQSAEHHDTLLWEVTYIIWGSTTLLLGFVLEAIAQEPVLSMLTAVLSIILSWMVWHFTRRFQQYRDLKYKICKEIETLKMDELGVKNEWKQHIATQSL